MGKEAKSSFPYAGLRGATLALGGGGDEHVPRKWVTLHVSCSHPANLS